MTRALRPLFALAPLASFACVPSGSAPAPDAGPAAAPTIRPSINVMRTSFEDNFERAATVSLPASASASPDAGPNALTASGVGDAAPAESAAVAAPDLGPDWQAAQTTAWRIENGKLCGHGAHNHGVWLRRVLPVNARIEFDAIAMSDEGDLKAEVWGDGQSAATKISYDNATSYLAILGGWHNTLHVLARINEHGTDRKEIKVDKTSDDPSQRPVAHGQVYRFKIERTDGKTVKWSVNGVDYLHYDDSAPLAGTGHDHFGFNDWEAKVCFDNVKVTPLP